MNKLEFRHIIRKKIKNMLNEADVSAPTAPAKPGAPDAKVQGSADFSAVAKTLKVNPQQLTSAINLIKQGKALNNTQNKILADLVVNMVKTQNDKIVQDFANQVKKLEVKENKNAPESIDESFLYMQKLAGIITEAQYKAKMQVLNEKKISYNMKEAIVNIVSDKLSDVFNEKGIMKSEVISNINKGLDIIKKQFPDLKIIDHFVVGAAVTYQYEDGSDIDTTVVLDPSTPPEKIKEVDKWIEKNLDGTMKHNARPYQFKVGISGRNKIDNADAAYDPTKKNWIKQPDAEQAKKMYQSKIGDKNSKENILYTQLEKIIQPSLKQLYSALSTVKETEETKTTDVAKGKTDIASFIKSAYARYEKGIKALRGKAYDAPPESGYVSQNWGKGNVIYKMFDREGYNNAFGIMKDIVKNEKFDDPGQLKDLKNALSKVIDDEPGYNP